MKACGTPSTLNVIGNRYVRCVQARPPGYATTLYPVDMDYSVVAERRQREHMLSPRQDAAFVFGFQILKRRLKPSVPLRRVTFLFPFILRI